jgi:predicted RNA binding protein YcfA (HicA-like mRNA interferase family)
VSPRLPRITARELLRALRRAKWEPIRQSGSHITLEHPEKLGSVTLPRHATVTIKPKTLASILKQAELTNDELRELL